jgi:hypothetical protein
MTHEAPSVHAPMLRKPKPIGSTSDPSSLADDRNLALEARFLRSIDWGTSARSVSAGRSVPPWHAVSVGVVAARCGRRALLLSSAVKRQRPHRR